MGEVAELRAVGGRFLSCLGMCSCFLPPRAPSNPETERFVHGLQLVCALESTKILLFNFALIKTFSSTHAAFCRAWGWGGACPHKKHSSHLIGNTFILEPDRSDWPRNSSRTPQILCSNVKTVSGRLHSSRTKKATIQDIKYISGNIK